MSDTDFLRLKIVTEKELGRDMDADEEHYLKALFYFGRGCKLKAQLANEPVHISEVLPGVMQRITERRKITVNRGCLQRYRRRRKSRVATGVNINKPRRNEQDRETSRK